MTKFEDETRLVPDSITGFRQFTVRLAGVLPAIRTLGQATPRQVTLNGALSSLNGTPWHAGKLAAECLNRLAVPKKPVLRVASEFGVALPPIDDWPEVEYTTCAHPAPERECSCGIYALLFPATWQYAHSYVSNREIIQTTVNGVIRASGRTTLGEIGFRTEKAEIVALTFPGHLSYMARRLVDMVRVMHPDIRIYHDHDEMYANHPETKLDSLFEYDTRAKMRLARFEYMKDGQRLPPSGQQYTGAVASVIFND